MIDFTFENATKIIFGKDTESQVGIETKRFGNKVLLHYGSGSIKVSGLYDKVMKLLKKEKITVFELPGVKPNPRLSLVREGIKICRDNKIDFILAVGGGSVIDSAKAIAMGVPYQGDVWDFFLNKTMVKEATPIGVILTIPAAGSEASIGCVITNEEGQYKRAVNTVLLRPKFAILNPELTYSLPSYQIACGTADIMAHIMERYFTNVRDVDLTDRLCEATLKTMIKFAPQALKDPENYGARAEIMWAGTIAHNDLLGTGRIGDWGSHDIEHEISGIYDIAHGAGLAIVFPAWMKYVYRHDINRFAQFAVKVWGVEPDFQSLEKTALEGIERLKTFFRGMGLPVSFRDTTIENGNVPDNRLEEMANKATEKGPIGNFLKLYSNDVLSILRLAK